MKESNKTNNFHMLSLVGRVFIKANHKSFYPILKDTIYNCTSYDITKAKFERLAVIFQQYYN